MIAPNEFSSRRMAVVRVLLAVAVGVAIIVLANAFIDPRSNPRALKQSADKSAALEPYTVRAPVDLIEHDPFEHDRVAAPSEAARSTVTVRTASGVPVAGMLLYALLEKSTSSRTVPGPQASNVVELGITDGTGTAVASISGLVNHLLVGTHPNFTVWPQRIAAETSEYMLVAEPLSQLEVSTFDPYGQPTVDVPLEFRLKDPLGEYAMKIESSDSLYLPTVQIQLRRNDGLEFRILGKSGLTSPMRIPVGEYQRTIIVHGYVASVAMASIRPGKNPVSRVLLARK